MGSISGFKEYVDKNHPACPLCGGATNRAKLPSHQQMAEGQYEEGAASVLDLELKRHELAKARECVNCGAVTKDGEILRGSN